MKISTVEEMNNCETSTYFRWITILKIEMFVLAFSIVFGYFIFSETLGWGDSLSFFSRPLSISEFIRLWWVELNGRMGQAALCAIGLLPLRWMSSTPENFPWWLVRSVDLFCILSAPLLMVAALQNVVIPRTWLSRCLLIVALGVVWTLNPRVSETSTLFSVADLIGYSGPIFLIALAFFVLRKLNPHLFTKRSMVIGIILASFFFATLGEQYLMVFPVLVLGVALVNVAKGAIQFSSAMKIGMSSIFGALLGFVLYWAAPAQQKRNVILDLHAGNLWDVYEKSITYGYMFLFHEFFSFEKSTIWILIIGHTVLVIAVIRLAIWDFKNDNFHFPPALRGSGVMLATLLVGFHVCFCTLLVANYFPGWAGMFPGLLLVMTITMVFLMLLKFIELKGFSEKLNGYIGYIAGFVVVIGVIYLANIEFRKYAVMDKQARENNHYRRASYALILNEASHSNTKNFVLINCPLAVPQYGWTMESPWGLSSYFSWSSDVPLKVFLQGNSDFPENWSDGSYKIIDCSAS